jgi:DegV family protein with EDD domain
MIIVTDNMADIPKELAKNLGIIKVPLGLSFNGISYKNTADVDPTDFYKLLRENPDQYPITSQPSVGQFVETFEAIVREGQEVFAVLISSGLSGTFNSAIAAAEIVKQQYQNAVINLFDTKTLSVAEGWQVLAAYRMAEAGKGFDEIQQNLERLQKNIKFFFTLDSLKYLIHGGRISHMQGMIASLLKIRPVITVDLQGKYIDVGKFPTFQRALSGMIPAIHKYFDCSRLLCFQVVHGENFSGVMKMTSILSDNFHCQIAPVVQGDITAGAHVGETIVGFAAGYADEIVPI